MRPKDNHGISGTVQCERRECSTRQYIWTTTTVWMREIYTPHGVLTTTNTINNWYLMRVAQHTLRITSARGVYVPFPATNSVNTEIINLCMFRRQWPKYKYSMNEFQYDNKFWFKRNLLAILHNLLTSNTLHFLPHVSLPHTQISSHQWANENTTRNLTKAIPFEINQKSEKNSLLNFIHNQKRTTIFNRFEHFREIVLVLLFSKKCNFF